MVQAVVGNRLAKTLLKIILLLEKLISEGIPIDCRVSLDVPFHHQPASEDFRSSGIRNCVIKCIRSFKFLNDFGFVLLLKLTLDPNQLVLQFLSFLLSNIGPGLLGIQGFAKF